MVLHAIEAFELVDHGIEHEQYFQGCGISCTEYNAIATGCGSNPAEAIDDALESLAQQDWDVDGMEERILAECFTGNSRRPARKLPRKPQVGRKQEDCYYYVSIRVR